MEANHDKMLLVRLYLLVPLASPSLLSAIVIKPCCKDGGRRATRIDVVQSICLVATNKDQWVNTCRN
jgi:hypothetical protein